MKKIIKTTFGFNFPDPEKIDMTEWNLRLKKIEILFNPMVQMKKRIFGKRPSFLVSISLAHDEILPENERVVKQQINELFQSKMGINFCKKYTIVPEGYLGKPVFNVDFKSWSQNLPVQILIPGELPKGTSQEQFADILMRNLLSEVLFGLYSPIIPCPRVVQETMVKYGGSWMDYGVYWKELSANNKFKVK